MRRSRPEMISDSSMGVAEQSPCSHQQMYRSLWTERGGGLGSRNIRKCRCFRRCYAHPAARFNVLLSMNFVAVWCASLSIVVGSSPNQVSVCDPSMQQCGRLGGLTYPFGKEGTHCGASSMFLLSECRNDSLSSPNTPAAYWDKFYGRPAVLALKVNRRINLTWASVNNTSSDPSSLASSSVCNTYTKQQLHLFLPNLTGNESAIDFRTSSSFSAFSFTPNNIILLFNCSNKANVNSRNIIEADSKNCKSFMNHCQSFTQFPEALKNSCAQFYAGSKLDLAKAMKSFGCSHYQFLLTENASLPVSDWVPHVVELSWASAGYNFEGGPSCRRCNSSGGTCGFKDDGSFLCFCSKNRSSSKDCDDLSNRSKLVIISATAAAAGVMFMILAMLMLHWTWKKKMKVFANKRAPTSSMDFRHQRTSMFSSTFGPVSAQEYSYHDLYEATNGFAHDHVIGDGGFGCVYRGVLKDGQLVAIKRLFHRSFNRMDHLHNEIRILSRLDHPNLVKLHGFCYENDTDLLLVFEYILNGSLFDQLHLDEVEAKTKLPSAGIGIHSWEVRLNIAMEIARALSYLHNTSPPILHRDVKTTNILLDEAFHAKLADFGLSRLVPLELTHVSTAPQGTPGYVDPEYHNCYRLTDKSDVYSFGVVLLELVSRKLPVDMSRSDKEINLSSMALLKEKNGTWKELVDYDCWHIEEDASAEVVAREMMQLAFWCLRPEKVNRPSMQEVDAFLTKLCQSYVGE
ncbi:hypothetical protein KP509_36G003200 [Ceratopteris richardii]|uniref:Protein kinase domain-containing protein n=1 Tax=Ceratopteris richardii TaxID=49495 RepID=A0A8T2Q906_CERRI|nr:hypothetical protein KP509_36G003200 [Ceratopteris richardii]